MPIAHHLDTYDPAAPLLLLDADEVLLQFVAQLEEYAKEQGLEVRLETFGLTGNIFDRASGKALGAPEVTDLIDDFFKACAASMKAVPYAAESLRTLSPHYQMCVVTNVPDFCRDQRAENLQNLGMPYPVLANRGGKGELIADICKTHTGLVTFVDDLPPQHASVAKHAPDTYRVHLVADPRLAQLIPKAKDAHIRMDCWQDLTAHLLDRI